MHAADGPGVVSTRVGEESVLLYTTMCVEQEEGVEDAPPLAFLLWVPTKNVHVRPWPPLTCPITMCTSSMLMQRCSCFWEQGLCVSGR